MPRTWTASSLTNNQKYMLAELREKGPYSTSFMRRNFGRMWLRTFHCLERKRVARFNPSANRAQHYEATPTTPEDH